MVESYASKKNDDTKHLGGSTNIYTSLVKECWFSPAQRLVMAKTVAPLVKRGYLGKCWVVCSKIAIFRILARKIKLDGQLGLLNSTQARVTQNHLMT